MIKPRRVTPLRMVYRLVFIKERIKIKEGFYDLPISCRRKLIEWGSGQKGYNKTIPWAFCGKGPPNCNRFCLKIKSKSLK